MFAVRTILSDNFAANCSNFEWQWVSGNFFICVLLQDYGNIKNLILHMEIHTVFDLRPASYLAYIHTQHVHNALPLLPLHVKHARKPSPLYSWHFLPHRTSTVDECEAVGFSSFMGGGCIHWSVLTCANSTLRVFLGDGGQEAAADSCSSLSLHVAMNSIFNSRG